MSQNSRRFVDRIIFLPGLVVAAICMLTTPSCAQEADPPKDKPADPSVLPGFPVQEGDDPLRLFVPQNPSTSEEKLKGEALAWFMTAQLHYSRGENDEGLAALKKVVEKDTSSLTPYRTLVPLLLEARDIEGARTYALRGAALKPEGIILVQAVAGILQRLRRTPEAISLLEEGLKSAPKDKDFGRHLSLVRQIGYLHQGAGRPKEAAERYQIVFDALKSADNKLSPEQIKEQLLVEPGILFDEFGQVFLAASQPEMALKAFDEASKYRPSRPAIHSYNLALLFRETKKPEQALAELDKYFAAQLQTKGRQAYQLLKDLLIDLKREGELLTRLQELHKTDPQNAVLTFFLGDQYVAVKQYDEALKTYTETPGSSRDPRALVGLIAVYREKKNTPELFSALTRALPLMPAVSDTPGAVESEAGELAIRFQGEVKAIGDDEETFNALVQHAQKVQKEEKLEFGPALIMGRFCLDVDRIDEAVGFYKYAISMQNNPSPRLFNDIAIPLIQAEKYKPAIEILTEAVQHPALEEERPYFVDLQIAALELDGQTDKAISVVTQAKQDYPRTLSLLSREAWIYYHAQQWEKAIAAYEALIQVGPALNAKPDVINGWRFSLSAIYVHIENLDKGERILEDILAKEPENTQANNDLGYLWADRGKNLERAKVMIEKALATEPENAAYLDSMGWVHFRLGNYSQAKDELLKAVKDPKRQDATIWDHLGDVYDKLGDKEEAIKAWVKALEIEFGKPKQEEKLVKALLGKIPADRIPMKESKEKK